MKNEKLLVALASLSQETPSPRTAARLRALGWLQGASTVTAAGREAIRQGAIDAEALAGQALGNYNEAADSRKSAATQQRHLDRSQRYLDVANILRGLA